MKELTLGEVKSRLSDEIHSFDRPDSIHTFPWDRGYREGYVNGLQQAYKLVDRLASCTCNYDDLIVTEPNEEAEIIMELNKLDYDGDGPEIKEDEYWRLVNSSECTNDEERDYAWEETYDKDDDVDEYDTCFN